MKDPFKRRNLRYAEKRRLRLVPLWFTDECLDLCRAIREGADEGRMSRERKRFEATCERSLGGRLWA